MSKSTGCRNEPSTSENDTMTMRMRFLFAALTLALAAGSCSREPRTELFNGRDLAGWVCVTDPEGVGDARDAFSVQNGNIRIAGSPFGYMRTEETYDDYRLHVEWRWIGEATNSGIFQRVQAGDRLWPEAVECQLQAGRAGDLLGLGGAKIAGAESNGRVFIKPRSGGECERPAGEWNCAEIVCVGDHIAVCVNGVLQNVQKKAGRLASNMGTINIYHIVLKSKLNALISWEMTKKARISIVNAIICARSSNTRKDWKLPKRKQKNIWAWNLKLKELHRPPETRHITAYPIRPGLRAVLFRSRQSEAWASLQVQRQSRGQPADWWPEQ